MKSAKYKARVLACIFTSGILLQAQDDSRAALIEQKQNEKAASVTPELQSGIERWFIRFKEERLLERASEGFKGFRPKAGGLVAGSGFAAGPEYRNADLWNGRLAARAAAQFSSRGYRKYEFEIGLPKLRGDRFFAELHGVHHDYPGLSYYGSGADSRKTGRTDFRLEDTAIDLTLGVRPVRRLTAGATAGYLFNNIGPGTDGRYASAELVYSPAQAPGIDRQANFARTGAFVQYDWRDDPGGPRRGGNYFAEFSDYRDRSLGLHDFRRLDLEAQQYIPFFNQRRVIALRGRSTMTFHDDGRTIPFYMQPSLGGSEDLRGYRPFRFRDDNLLAASAEYRWEVFSGLDMALFADAGKVYARRTQLEWSRVQSDVGLGFRFNARNRTFLRLDVAVSREGFQVWVKFNSVFRKGPVRTSSSMGDF